jgi:hypothetical protein
VPQTEIEVLVHANGRDAKLIVKRDSNTICDVPITADEIIDGIQKFGNARAALHEEVSMTLDPIVRLGEVNYPVWMIPNYTDGGDRLFILRHPAVGWTSWRFSQNEANKIAEWLTKKVESRPNRAMPSGRRKK